MNILLIDNHDSFVYNLRQLLVQEGADVTVVRNDTLSLSTIDRYDGFVLSPGPGLPQETANLEAVIRMYAGSKPMLGICLGEQAIGTAFGGKMKRMEAVLHGVQTRIRVLRSFPLFKDISNDLRVGHYHSWVLDADALPPCLEVTADMENGDIMAIRHRCHEIYGLQFHPESILTPEGDKIIMNFLARIKGVNR